MSNIRKVHWDDIIFRGRNQSYGAYVIRKAYGHNTQRAFFMAAFFMTALFMVPGTLQKLWYNNQFSAGLVDETTYLHEYVPPKPIEVPRNEPARPEPPPLQPEKPKQGTTAFTNPDVGEHNNSNATIPDQQDLQNTQIGNRNEEGETGTGNPVIETNTSGNGTTPNVEPPKPEPPVVVEKDYDFAPVMPSPQNLDAIKRNIHYPSLLKDVGTEGKVVLQVLVDKTGKPIKHRILRSSHDLFTRACVDEIYNLRFNPGKNNGLPVNVWVTIPFQFMLRN